MASDRADQDRVRCPGVGDESDRPERVPSFVLAEWWTASTAPDAVADPQALAEVAAESDWIAAAVPGTAAGALRDAGRWTFADQVDFDASDWWFRTTFRAEPSRAATIEFGGIATVCEVWLNGTSILTSDNMFLAADVTVALEAENELVVCCRSLHRHLAGRRPRPRWKTRLVEQQQLRWVRTTLLGRMPSWTPAAAPVGLWRQVTVWPDGRPQRDAPVRTRRWTTDHDGAVGTFHYAGTIAGAVRPTRARLQVGDHSVDLDIVDGERHDDWIMEATLRAPGVTPWFPATHGEPALHPASLYLTTPDGKFERSIGRVGFRSITVDDEDGSFSLVVNGVPVFARGACWTPPDVVTLRADRHETRNTLVRLVAAGFNLVRITGTTVYEDADFYELCDELGMMVWQDFMFANLDYPIADAHFAHSVAAEVAQTLDALVSHACVVVLCGGSEVEQQAAMMGLDPTTIANELGRVVLPGLVRQHAAGAAGAVYVPCSPSGGTFPFSPASGVSHYYGIGAYRRPLDDARRANVRFASECLAFANVPSRAQVDDFLLSGEAPGHSPGWKVRIPRDRGAGWDFEDIRDFYVRELFGCDPFAVRASDPDRYLDLGRAAVHAVIEATISEWRRPESGCSGAVVLMMRDLWPGAGWGVLDSTGAPKSAFDALARVCAPTAVLLTDEGLNGLYAHLVHDGSDEFVGTLRVRAFGFDGHLVASATADAELPPHGSAVVSVDGVLGGFRDLTYAYRFGPPAADVVSVQLLAGNRVVSDAMYLVGGHRRDPRTDIGLHACGVVQDGVVSMRVATDQFAQFVAIDVPGHVPEVNWFHLAPGDVRTVRLMSRGGPPPRRGEIRALNQLGSRSVKFAEVVRA